MYNIKLFQVFYEGDLLFASEEFCKSLASVLNDKLSAQLIQFVADTRTLLGNDDNAVANKLRESLALLEEHTLPRAHILTLHIRLSGMKFHNSSMFDYIRTLSLESIRPQSLSTNEVMDIYSCLTNVIPLIPNMVDRIEARQKLDYERFLTECKTMSQQSDTMRARMSGTNSNLLNFGENNCAQTVEDNKELFYSYKEPARYTGLGQIIRKRQDLNTIYSGLRYISYCDNLGVSMMERGLI